MLRRKCEVYQTVMRIVHPQIPSHSLKHPSNATNIPFVQNWEPCPSRSISFSRNISKDLSWSNRISIESSRTTFSPNHITCHQRRRYRIHQKHSSSQKLISSCYSTQTCISRLQHRNLKNLHAKRQTYPSTYDPELAACMDRWIRIAFPGQKRIYTSITKQLYSPATSAYTVVHMTSNASQCDPMAESNAGQPHSIQNHQKLGTDTILPSTSLSEATLLSDASPELVSNFRKSMDEINYKDHQLPKAFRPLGANKKLLDVMLSREERRKIDIIWNSYTEFDKRQLTRQDFTKLMRIMCYSFNPMEGARRVVTIQNDLNQYGITPTQKMLEMAAQASVILGSIPESVNFYNRSAAIVKHGTLYHKKLLWTMIDAFAVNKYASQGIAFLDKLSPFFPENEDPMLYMHKLYHRLFLYQFDESMENQRAKSPYPHHMSLIKTLVERPFVPLIKHVAQTIVNIKGDEKGDNLSRDIGNSIGMLSKVASGMIIKCSSKASQMATMMIQNLLLYDQMEEATRVLEMVLQNKVKLDMGQIRSGYLMLIDTGYDNDRLFQILERWEATVALRRKIITEEFIMKDLGATERIWNNYLSAEYTNLITNGIKEFNMPLATAASKYMSKYNRIASGADFQSLNSIMVNHYKSFDYLPYLEIRYSVGFPPDFLTYRRLVYASCRRSDVSGALFLLKTLKARHPDWPLDTAIYNAIISSAAASGNFNVARSTFRRIIKDRLNPGIRSYHGLLNSYCEAGDLRSAIKVSEQMIKRNLNPTTMTFNLIIKAYLKHSLDMTTSMKLFTAMQQSGIKGVPPDIVTFNQLLEGYRKVGNLMWFDAYYDTYFGSKSACNEEATDINSRTKSDIEKANNIIRVDKPSDWTLFIQLRYSLSLPDISLTTIQELWRTLEPRLSSGQVNQATIDIGTQPRSSYPGVKLIKTADDELPSTHVPFKKRFGTQVMPGTDRAHFRFLILNLFRYSFSIHGDVAGLKSIDKILAAQFPNHPMGQAILERKFVKTLRHRKNL